MTNPQDIYSYITAEETNYKLPIDLMGWSWSMADHIKQAYYYKHSRLLTGNDDMKPVKNIVRPILNLQYRSEDFDVKDIFIYVDDPNKFDLSFFIKKYHDEVFLKEHDLDTFLDRANENRIDYGGALIKDVGKGVPEVVPWNSVAFCDQTDILAGPIGLRHFYSPDQLKEMEDKGWGSSKNGATVTIDDLILLSRNSKKEGQSNTNVTPGKYIEVYEVHGNLPESFLRDTDSGKYVNQLHIVAFYNKVGGGKEGVTLFKGKEEKSPFSLILRDPVDGRALGFGAVEELVEAQVWTNYTQLKYRELLDAAATTVHQTTDSAFARQGRLHDVGSMKVALMGEGTTLSQVDTFPRNINLFNQYAQEWEAHAQTMGAANDSIMGKAPTSGTPFKLQELVTNESHSLHDFRRGKYAKDIEKVYRDCILPFIKKEVMKGQQFLANLSVEEMQSQVEKVVNRQIDDLFKAGQLKGMDIDAKKEELTQEFMKDSRKFIEILKEDVNNVPLSININVAGKQKDMYLYTDKLVNIFRQISSSVNPQTGQSVLDDPRMAKLFNKILEASGMEPMDFSTPPRNAMPAQPVQPGQPELTPTYAPGQNPI